MGSGVGVLVGFSVGVGKGVAVGSIVKFGVAVSVGNLYSAPMQEDIPKANRMIIPKRMRLVLIFQPLFSTYGKYIQDLKHNPKPEEIQENLHAGSE